MLKKVLLLGAIMMSATAFAQEQEEMSVSDKIVEAQPQFEGASIRVGQELSEYGLEGFYEVNIQGQDVILTPDGRYAILGDLFDLSQMVNISEQSRNARIGEVAGEVIAGLDESIMIKYTHDESVDHLGHIYVFTDPTCPYCGRVHEELDQYLEAGVSVYYIPYPRSGVSSNGRDYQMLTKSLCSDDPQATLDAYKSGGSTAMLDMIDGSACHDAVAAGYAAGQEIGLSGTPFIYLSNGGVVPGYNPAQSIIERLQQ